MRFKSAKTGPYQVMAVSGTNTISFAISADKAGTKGLLGFAVERSDPGGKQDFYTFGFKVFPSLIPKPDDKTKVKTSRHPVQSFVWDDFTGKPDHKYEYIFHPLKGTPKKLDRTAEPVAIRVQTEPLFSALEHDIFFNRGVASSQAYTREFGNKKPSELKGAKQVAAKEWLSRQLDDAILKFVADAGAADTLLCCFYEFRYEPVAQALKDALDRGVDVRLIVDAKKNKPKDSKGKPTPSFPRTENLALIDKVGIPPGHVFLREARTNNIQHNKFMTFDFVAPARVGDWVEGRAEVVRQTRSLLFTNIYLTVGEEKFLRASRIAKIPLGEGLAFGKAKLDRSAAGAPR